MYTYLQQQMACLAAGNWSRVEYWSLVLVHPKMPWISGLVCPMRVWVISEAPHSACALSLTVFALLQRLQGEVFLFMDMCGSLLATLRL